MNITHIVGLNGTGKSTLAELMVASLESRGAKCAVVDSETMAHDFKGDTRRAAAGYRQVDQLFLEHLPECFDGGMPGDKVIRIDYVTELAPAQAHQPQPATDVVAQGV